MSSRCTCLTDRQMTCIEHPTYRSLKDEVARLKQENARLREALQEIASDDYEDLSHHTMVMIAKDALQESSDG